MERRRRRRRGKRRRRSNLTVRKVQVQVPSRSIAVCRRRKAGIINGCTLTPPPPAPWRQTFQTNISRSGRRRRKQPRSTLFLSRLPRFLKATQLSFPASFFFFYIFFCLNRDWTSIYKIYNIYSLDIYIYILRPISLNKILSIRHLVSSISFYNEFSKLNPSTLQTFPKFTSSLRIIRIYIRKIFGNIFLPLYIESYRSIFKI